MREKTSGPVRLDLWGKKSDKVSVYFYGFVVCGLLPSD
jgi:hypothetical protein